MSEANDHRRRFMTYCTEILLAGLSLLVAIPAIGYLLAPLWKREGAEAGFIDMGRLADLPIGEWRLLALEMVHQDGWKKAKFRHSLWVRRKAASDQEVTVLSPICPHLGCPINWHPDRSQFVSPCHGGVFDAEGRYIAGPPPRSMDPIEFQVRAGRLLVRWQEFKIGVAQRVPVST
jgi:Rieske Fe-S protein